MNPTQDKAASPLDIGNLWIHVVPKGDLPNQEAGIVQVLDEQSLDSILANIQKDKSRLGDNWPGVYGGKEHHIYDPGQDSVALAWFKDFEKRPNGIWASAKGLTPSGKRAMENREYKFTSFCANPSDCQKLDGKQNGLPRYRVLKIDTIGFTNLPNGKEILTPITNRGVMDNLKREVDVKADFERNLGPGKKAADPLPLSDLEEKWCGAVKGFMDAAKARGNVMTVASAWSEAQSRFPKLYQAAFNSDQASPAQNRFNSSFDTKKEHAAAEQENLRHTQANKDAQNALDAQRRSDTEGETTELGLPALEKFCRAVKNVMDSGSRTGHQMMTLPAAWAYAKQKFPDLYAAAFAPDTEDDSGDVDAAQAASITQNVANRVSEMTDKGFQFGWDFVREELPAVFNRMTPARAGARVMNRLEMRVAQINTPNAAKVFNRLVRAESAISRLTDSQALAVIAERHPGLYGLASGKMLASDALRTEPSVADLLT